MALKIFKSARAALEGTRGTDLTPTRLLYFEDGEFQQTVATIRPSTLGSYFAFRQGASAGTETNALTFSGVVTYEDLIWWANTHIKAVPAGVAGAGGEAAAITWAFVPTGTSDDVKSATIQIGYTDSLGASQPAAKLNYCLGDELSIKWSKADDDGAVRFTSNMVSPTSLTQITAFTGSLSDRTVVPASANTTVVTIDSTTIGTTADNYWIDAEFTLTNGYQNLYTLNNTTSAIGTFRPNARTWKLEGQRYYQADTEWDAFIAKTVRKMRIKTTGAVIPTTTTAKSITLDLYGVYTSMENAESDGLGVQKFTLEGVYDTTATTDFSLTVINAVASIT